MDALRDADIDGDGMLDKREVLRVMRNLLHARRRATRLQNTLWILLAAFLLVSVACFVASYIAIQMTKDSKVDRNVLTSISGEALQTDTATEIHTELSAIFDYDPLLIKQVRIVYTTNNSTSITTTPRKMAFNVELALVEECELPWCIEQRRLVNGNYYLKAVQSNPGAGKYPVTVYTGNQLANTETEIYPLPTGVVITVDRESTHVRRRLAECSDDCISPGCDTDACCADKTDQENCHDAKCAWFNFNAFTGNLLTSESSPSWPGQCLTDWICVHRATDTCESDEICSLYPQ